MNKLCISKLVQFIDTENVPRVVEETKPRQEGKNGSRSISRVLSAVRVGRHDDHFSRKSIARFL